VVDACELEPTGDTELAAVKVRESEAARARSLDGAVTFDSCPLDGPDELAELCAGFGITSQDACFVLEGAMAGSGCLLGSISDGDLEVVP
jgi:hypothetical protein